MEQIKLISAGFTIPHLEADANRWLRENADKDILDVSIVSHSTGWLAMIRYKERQVHAS